MLQSPYGQRVSGRGRTPLLGRAQRRRIRRAGHGVLIGALLLSSPYAGVGGPGGEPASQDLLAPLPTDTDAVRRLQQELGGKAHPLETEHFLLVHRATEDTVRDVAARLEAVYRANARLVRELGLSARRPERKLEVLIFSTHAEFCDYQWSLDASGEEILGLYDPSSRRSAFFDLQTYPPIAKLREELQQLGRAASPQRARLSAKLRRNTEALLAKVVQHEAAHQVHDQTGVLPVTGNAPTWLAEGLAQMFELPFVERTATLELSTNRYRLYEFVQLHRDDAALLDDLRRVIGADRPWRGRGDYSLSWALTNYLYKRQRGRFAEYLRQAASPPHTPDRTPAARLREFEHDFGPVDEDFASRWREYMSRLRDRHGVPDKAHDDPGG